jgi:ABC-type multidrug transport system ATPase subunit
VNQQERRGVVASLVAQLERAQRSMPSEAPREAEADALVWSGLCYRVQRRFLLSNVSGCARPGRLLAVIGPSGCGKSTLLNILASRLPKQRRAVLGGHLRLPGNAGVGYTGQDSAACAFANLTVRETLELAARLRGADAGVEDEVQATIRQLGLAEVERTLVGGESGGHVVPGISGGERRRLSMACELISSHPSIFLADEPTSGLDSAHAARVLESLRDLARTGCCVVSVLHQTGSASFPLLDDLLLLAPGGRVAYTGPADQALA